MSLLNFIFNLKIGSQSSSNKAYLTLITYELEHTHTIYDLT